MTRRTMATPFIIGCVAIVWFGLVSAQERRLLTDAEIAAGIALAAKQPNDYMGRSSEGLRDAVVIGRLGRVGAAAWNAKQKSLPYTPADVIEDFRRDQVVVQITAKEPAVDKGSGGFVVADAVTGVSLRGADGATIQPIEMKLLSQQWDNGTGLRIETRGAQATFRSLPAGDFDVVVTSKSGQAIHHIRGTERAKIQ